MSDALRKVYEGAGALDRYHDKTTPLDLFRGRRTGDTSDLMQPTLIGWYQKLRPRRPDVLVQNDQGSSPQYEGGDLGRLVTEAPAKPVTADILRHADQYIVKGCRTMSGDHRGVSVFDKKNTGLRHFEWYKLPKGTAIPDSLAVTRDATYTTSPDPIHYTVAPKDDMSLALFLQTLKALGAQATKD